MAGIMAKQRLILLLTIIFCIPVMVSGCKGVDMSTPRKTVEGYLEALENYDYDKVAQYLGQPAVDWPTGPDLEFRNIRIAVTSQTDTEATVYAEWDIWVEYEGLKIPAEEMELEFKLRKSDGDWIIIEFS